MTGRSAKREAILGKLEAILRVLFVWRAHLRALCRLSTVRFVKFRSASGTNDDLGLTAQQSDSAAEFSRSRPLPVDLGRQEEREISRMKENKHCENSMCDGGLFSSHLQCMMRNLIVSKRILLGWSTSISCIDPLF